MQIKSCFLFLLLLFVFSSCTSQDSYEGKLKEDINNRIKDINQQRKKLLSSQQTQTHPDFKDVQAQTQYQSSLDPNAFTHIDDVEDAVWKVVLKLNIVRHSIKEEQDKQFRHTVLTKRETLLSLGEGSGFFISPTLFVTNFHVIDSAVDGVDITLQKDVFKYKTERRKARLINVSSIYDLALLEVDKPVDQYLNIRSYPINFKEESRFYLVGYPVNRFVTLALKYRGSKFNSGVFEFIHDDYKDARGSSGGAVVDANGQVIGVNYAGSLYAGGRAFVISYTTLLGFISSGSGKCLQGTPADCIDADWQELRYASNNGNKIAEDKIQVSNYGYQLFKKKRDAFVEFIKEYKNLDSLTKKLYNSIVDLNKAEEAVAITLRDYKDSDAYSRFDTRNKYEQAYEDYKGVYGLWHEDYKNHSEAVKRFNKVIKIYDGILDKIMSEKKKR